MPSPMQRIILTTFRLLGVAIALSFANPKVAAQAIKNEGQKARPFSKNAVQLTSSWISQRENLNSRYIKSLDPDRLLHNFRVNSKLPSSAKPLDGWEAPSVGLRGHFTGHYLSAASILVARNQDTLLKKRLDYIVDELYKCQQSSTSGYLAGFPESEFSILEEKFTGVWAPYYTYHKMLQGLLDVFVYTNNAKAYEIAVKMATYVQQRMSRLDRGTIEKLLYTPDANPANEPGAMNEVLYRLYKISNSPEHLALAKLFDRDWFANPLSANKDILSGLHSNTHLVLVNGFAERYLITHDKAYHDAVFNFWNMLINHHSYANGSSSGPRPNVTTAISLTAEHWGLPDHLSNTMTKEIAESCVTHNTQKLTSTLFTWTADPMYATEYMNTFYNAVLPTQHPQKGTNVYHLPLGSPRVKSFLKENDFRCCNGTGIEAFASLNSGISWADKGIILEQTGEFPSDSTLKFTISSRNETAFNLNLLIPAWAKKADIFVNGHKQNEKVKPSSYYAINRKWKNNDEIKIVFHYDFYIKTMPDDPKTVAIFYGPSLLAFETTSEIILKGTKEELLKKLSKGPKNTFHLNEKGRSSILRPLYDIEDQSYGVYGSFRDY